MMYWLSNFNVLSRLFNDDEELLSENELMPYPKDTIGLQNPNLGVASVSYCTQCENTGRYIDIF